MRNFDELLYDDIRAYEGRHDDLIYQAPALYRLLTHLLDDPALPGRLRPLILAAVAYFILPADIIPEDLHGPYGYLDDLFLCAFVAEQVRQQTGSDRLLTENWDGEGPVIPLIHDILSQEQELLGGQKELLLSYIGYRYLEKLERD